MARGEAVLRLAASARVLAGASRTLQRDESQAGPVTGRDRLVAAR